MSPPEFPDFAWASGEESSDPIVHFDGRELRIDEMESTGHLDRLEGDICDVAALGIDTLRYGIPWRRVEAEPGVYNWTLWDRALAACEETRVTPVVDLCHFGLPDHYPGFARADWIEGFRRYVEAFCARYPQINLFTLVNEPTTTALQSGMFGTWNDGLAGPSNYARILAHCILADLEAFAQIRADRPALNVGAEVFFVPVVTDDAQQPTADQFSALWQATWDLRFGLPLHPLAEEAFTDLDDMRTRIDKLATHERVIAGHDFYPSSVMVFGDRGPLTIDERIVAYRDAAAAWHSRYGAEFWVAETSNLSLPAEDGPRWLETLAGALFDMRADMLPVRGLCWYSRGDQHDWDSALTRPEGRVTEVGLFDIDRRPRPVAETFRRLVKAGSPPSP